MSPIGMNLILLHFHCYLTFKKLSVSNLLQDLWNEQEIRPTNRKQYILDIKDVYFRNEM